MIRKPAPRAPEDGDATAEAFFRKAASLERAVSALYTTFADRFPEDAELWRDMAAQEDEHAEWLESFPDLVKGGSAKASLLRPSTREIDEGIRFVNAEAARAVGRSATAAWAREAARLIETSTVEKNYARLLVAATGGLQELLQRLVDATRAHIARLGGDPKANL